MTDNRDIERLLAGLMDAISRIAKAVEGFMAHVERAMSAIADLLGALEGREFVGDDGETYIWQTVDGSTPRPVPKHGHTLPILETGGCNAYGGDGMKLREPLCTIVNHSEPY